MICCWDHGSYLFKQSACKLKKAFIKTIKRCIGKEMWLRWRNIFKVDYLIEEKINYIYKKSYLKGIDFNCLNMYLSKIMLGSK